MRKRIVSFASVICGIVAAVILKAGLCLTARAVRMGTQS